MLQFLFSHWMEFLSLLVELLGFLRARGQTRRISDVFDANALPRAMSEFCTLLETTDVHDPAIQQFIAERMHIPRFIDVAADILAIKCMTVEATARVARQSIPPP